MSLRSLASAFVASTVFATASAQAVTFSNIFNGPAMTVTGAAAPAQLLTGPVAVITPGGPSAGAGACDVEITITYNDPSAAAGASSAFQLYQVGGGPINSRYSADLTAPNGYSSTVDIGPLSATTTYGNALFQVAYLDGTGTWVWSTAPPISISTCPMTSRRLRGVAGA